MKYLKLTLILALVGLMAVPAFGKRRQPKKNAGALISSTKIALADDPPRYEEAMGYLNEVIEDNGMVPEAYFYRGSIYAAYAEQEYDPAKKLEFLKKMAANQDSLHIACTSDDVKSKYKSDCDEFLSIADSTRVYYWRNSFNNAVKIVQRVDDKLLPDIASAPDSASKAAAEEKLNASADSAKAYFHIAMLVDTANYRSFEGMALIYDRLGDYDSSLAYFEKAVKLAPDEPNLIQSVAYSYIQRNDWEDAVKYFKELAPFLKDQPEALAGTYFNMAICYNNLKLYDSSFVYNKKAVEADSTKCSAIVDIGQYFLIESQNYSDSVKKMNQANKHDEADKFVKMKDKSLDSSSTYFEKAIRCDSTNTLALEQGAIVNMIRGKFDDACPKFEKLTVLVPNEKDYWLSLGDCRVQQGKFEEAIEPYEKYIELDSSDCNVWKQLESLYKNLKMPEKLKKAQAKIKELNCK